MRILPAASLLLITAGCTSGFHEEMAKSTAIAAAYEGSDEKQRGMSQREYEEQIRSSIERGRAIGQTR